MSGVNKAMIIGRLGKDVEMRYKQDGGAIANFTVATSEEWKDKATGEKRERTEWHRCVAFGRLAEICGDYLTKGQQVYIEGRISYGQYEKDGITRYTTDIIASTMQMLGGRNDAGGDPGRTPEPGPESVDDDIPF